jgi:hypothetical protein
MKTLAILLFTIALSSAGHCQSVEESRDVAVSIVRSGVNVLDGRRDNLFTPDSKISSAALEGLELPAKTVELSQDLTLISGCRPSSCDEKAAAIVNGKLKELKAIAIRNFSCHYNLFTGKIESPTKNRSNSISCDREPVINIYIFRTKEVNADNEIEFVDNLKKWGEEVGTKKQKVYIVSTK